MMLCFPSRVLNYTWPRTEVLMESDRPLIGIVEGAHAGYTIWHGRRHVVLSGYGPHDDGLNEMSRGVWLITPRTTVHVDDAEIE
jgi:hypothetical protein